MIPIIIKLIEYRRKSNDFIGELQNGNKIIIDPFVSCAIDQDDRDFEDGNGFLLQGESYCLTIYTVYSDNVVPHEGGMMELQ